MESNGWVRPLLDMKFLMISISQFFESASGEENTPNKRVKLDQSNPDLNADDAMPNFHEDDDEGVAGDTSFAGHDGQFEDDDDVTDELQDMHHKPAPKSPIPHLNPSTAATPPKSRSRPPAQETHDCPICGKTITADNQGFNAHVDFCLSRGAILEAQSQPSGENRKRGDTKPALKPKSRR